jgi:hypothetical protein
MRTLIYTSPVIGSTRVAMKTVFVCLLFAVAGRNAMAQSTDTAPVQEHTIAGIVRSGEDNEPIAFVNVYVKDASEGTVTDAEGRFVFPRKLKTGEILVFSFVGLERQQYTVPQQVPDLLEVTMFIDAELIVGELAMTEKCGNVQQSGIRRLLARITRRM